MFYVLMRFSKKRYNKHHLNRAVWYGHRMLLWLVITYKFYSTIEYEADENSIFGKVMEKQHRALCIVA